MIRTSKNFLPARHAIHAMVAAWLIACAGAPSAVGASDLKHGDPAPSIALPDISGAMVDLAAMKGRNIVLLFGESHQERTIHACEEITAVLHEPETKKANVIWVTVLAKHSDAEQFNAAVSESRPPDHVVMDSDRTAFGAYGVVVAPTTVVIDEQGRIVHVLAGFNYRYGDNLYNTLLFLRGRLTAEDFKAALEGQRVESQSDQTARAARTARLAYRLHRRGMFDLAEQKYKEALTLRPEFPGARVAYGAMLIEQGRLDDASRQYLRVLESSPEDHGALVGLAHICIRSDPADLVEAEQLLMKALDSRPDSAPAHYLMGAVYEEKGDLKEAARRYRIAATLALKLQWPAEPVMSDIVE